MVTTLNLPFMSNLHIFELYAHFSGSHRNISLLLSILSKYLFPVTLEHFRCKIKIYDRRDGKAFVEGLRTCSIWTLDALASQLRKVTITLYVLPDFDERQIIAEEIRDLLRRQLPMVHARAILFVDVYVA